MLDINNLKQQPTNILFLGSHPGIIQSILDFDYLAGKSEPSVKGIIAGGRRFERFFFGKKEILLPVSPTVSGLSESIRSEITYFFNTTSGRRAFSSTQEAFEVLPKVLGGIIFAEDVPEEHAAKLYQLVEAKNKFVIGPASVGLLLPNILKLGAIGGVDTRQLIASDVFIQGNVAVFSASGEMTNEIINIVAKQGRRLSFALSFGGDRFPVLTPQSAFEIAENDPQTETIIYFGELGGTDEYDVVRLLKEKKVNKPVLCYIGGVVADLFETPPQFGHAKALAETGEETARAKRDALREAGAQVAESFGEFVELIGKIKTRDKINTKDYTLLMKDLSDRQHALITSSISSDEKGDVKILGEDLLEFVQARSFAGIVASLFLGKAKVSKDLEDFVDFTLRLLVDHGPYVSGAVNTIITARAGRDLSSSLAAGLLTIGPRFGGAINQAAINWLEGVTKGVSAHDFVEEFAIRKEYISGIGHRKYRVDLPDPRVNKLLEFSESLKVKRFTSFAKDVAAITTAKKGNLILNVDGTIAAVLLDLLSEKEGMTDQELDKITRTEFLMLFLFCHAVSVFIAHFLDQKSLMRTFSPWGKACHNP